MTEYEHINKLPPAEKEKLLQAVNRLANGNADIAELMEKLAGLKENKPLKFKMAVHKLKGE